ncbi:hypothetical protein P9112_002374 [Eukaryota sp. TZLM1-RC]
MINSNTRKSGRLTAWSLFENTETISNFWKKSEQHQVVCRILVNKRHMPFSNISLIRPSTSQILHSVSNTDQTLNLLQSSIINSARRSNKSKCNKPRPANANDSISEDSNFFITSLSPTTSNTASSLRHLVSPRKISQNAHIPESLLLTSEEVLGSARKSLRDSLTLPSKQKNSLKSLEWTEFDTLEQFPELVQAVKELKSKCKVDQSQMTVKLPSLPQIEHTYHVPDDLFCRKAKLNSVVNTMRRKSTDKLVLKLKQRQIHREVKSQYLSFLIDKCQLKSHSAGGFKVLQMEADQLSRQYFENNLNNSSAWCRAREHFCHELHFQLINVIEELKIHIECGQAISPSFLIDLYNSLPACVLSDNISLKILICLLKCTSPETSVSDLKKLLSNRFVEIPKWVANS